MCRGWLNNSYGTIVDVVKAYYGSQRAWTKLLVFSFFNHNRVWSQNLTKIKCITANAEPQFNRGVETNFSSVPTIQRQNIYTVIHSLQ